MARDEARRPEGVRDPTHAALAPLLAAARGALARGDAARALESVEWLLDEALRRFAEEERRIDPDGAGRAGAHAADHEAVTTLLRDALRRARAEGRWEGVHHLATTLDDWLEAHARLFHPGRCAPSTRSGP